MKCACISLNFSVLLSYRSLHELGVSILYVTDRCYSDDVFPLWLLSYCYVVCNDFESCHDYFYLLP